MSRDLGELTESLGNEQSLFSKISITSPTSEPILHPFRRFTYVSSFSNPSIASPRSRLILQPFFRLS